MRKTQKKKLFQAPTKTLTNQAKTRDEELKVQAGYDEKREEEKKRRDVQKNRSTVTVLEI